MINLSFYEIEVEQVFFDEIKPVVNKFNIEFINKVEIHRVENTLNNVDTWLGLCSEEISNIKTKEDLIDYLRKKGHCSRELRKRAMELHDRFESYEIAMELMANKLENKPMEDSTSIPTENDIEEWMKGINPCLQENDLEVINFLREKSKEFEDQ